MSKYNFKTPKTKLLNKKQAALKRKIFSSS